MMGDTLIAWIVLGLGIAVYLITSLVTSLSSRRSPGMRLLASSTETDNGSIKAPKLVIVIHLFPIIYIFSYPHQSNIVDAIALDDNT